MAEHSPYAQQSRERGGVRLASPAAYDRWFDTGWGRDAFTVEQAAIERAAGCLDGLRVLDAGCGTGRFTAALERRGARLAGVDLDPAMLDVAARRVRAPLLAADARELPFRDAVFDVTIAVTVCELTDSPAALVARAGAGDPARGPGRDRRAEPPQCLGTGPAPPAAPAALAGRAVSHPPRAARPRRVPRPGEAARRTGHPWGGPGHLERRPVP